LKDQFSVDVCDTLREVDIRILTLSLHVAQDRPKNRGLLVSFPLEADVGGTFVEVLALPVKVS
jgi:hypothetical protein